MKILKPCFHLSFFIVILFLNQVLLSGCAAPPAGPTQEGVSVTPLATALPSQTLTPQKPTPAATLTRAEEILLERLNANPLAASSWEQCQEILKTETECYLTNWVKAISRPEWEQLFPQAEFYIEQYDRIQSAGLDEVVHLYYLIVEQDGQRYTPQTYDHFLDANSIVVTDENRQLIAEGWALMTIPAYLQNEVRFTNWEAVEMPDFLHNFNYCLDGWAKLGGFQAKWCYVFSGTQLKIASGPAFQQFQVGDYIESDIGGQDFIDHIFYVK